MGSIQTANWWLSKQFGSSDKRFCESQDDLSRPSTSARSPDGGDCDAGSAPRDDPFLAARRNLASRVFSQRGGNLENSCAQRRGGNWRQFDDRATSRYFG